MENFLLDEPSTLSSTACIFVPGVSGGALTEKYTPLATTLNASGIALFRLEPWKSKDLLESLTVNKIRDEIENAVNLLHRKKYVHVFGIGKSFGGAMLVYTAPSLFERLVLWAPAIQLASESTIKALREVPFGKIDSIFDIHPSKDDLSTCPPALVVRGSDDTVVSADSMDACVAALPDGSLITIPNMGHSPASNEEAGKLYEITKNYIMGAQI